jgi:hypothetical protein
MNPKIDEYLRRNGAEYTTKALRSQLLKAGYEAGEVDAALQETEAARAPRLAETKALRSQFWVVAWVVNFVVLVAVSALVSNNSPYAGATFIVLGIVMLLGLGISGIIGSAFLPGRGLLFALAVPVAVALILGGTCFAMMQPGLGSSGSETKMYGGTMELGVDPPLAFSGSGSALCQVFPDGSFSVTASVGSIDGHEVNVSVASAIQPNGSVQGSTGERRVIVNISILNIPGDASTYGNEFSMQVAADGLSGTTSFAGLEKQNTGSGATFGPDSMDGTVSWTCDTTVDIGSHGP